MKQTAVEWLEEALEDTILTKEQIMQTIGLFEQAKEMEKEQIMDAIKFTIQDEFIKQTWKNGKCSHDTALNYYNKTFKSE